ncbi:MAG TPA: hypothetical protein VFX70_23255, partial [Mycobacteriales bacterium]|nr:hypothetical protein [Mycobacteriales bacterium]
MTTGTDDPAAPADTPTGSSGPVAEPGEIESMVAQARERARAAVVEELVAELIPAYRRAVGALATPPNHSRDQPNHHRDHRDHQDLSQDQTRDAGRVGDAPAIAWYVYAVARHDDLVGLVVDDLVGVEGGPVT